ncbi:hypothetical protein LMG28614_06607 [Paraburkholderia ultramafica]|uniref:Protein MgtC n=1 Tax=Paraburkholderia ultramafica TaxID=1544867 RepID=A0A6S7BPA3_9BURK|nr:MgtC/SapB family protein [Paraburkholderia ultramafica]CAB3807477.1 hypothetical protein LMG28614_06607 [Paraburkholderia ultramafica]
MIKLPADGLKDALCAAIGENTQMLSANTSIALHLAGAFVLGSLVGYERHFRGRAAGTQVYAIVCMASCAVTILAGYPQLWYAGALGGAGGTADPTRVIGSIVTGVGFLGAGLIVQDGSNVRGLTTAASVWACAVIGILVGTSLFAPAVGLTGLLLLGMVAMPTVERILPARTALTVKVQFAANYRLHEEAIDHFALMRRFSIPPESFSISYDAGRCSIQFLIVADPRRHANALAQLSTELRDLPHVESFTIARSTT